MIDSEITKFIEVTKSSDEAGEYILSQLVYLVGELPRTKQVEFFKGLFNAAKEMKA